MNRRSKTEDAQGDVDRYLAVWEGNIAGYQYKYVSMDQRGTINRFHTLPDSTQDGESGDGSGDEGSFWSWFFNWLFNR